MYTVQFFIILEIPFYPIDYHYAVQFPNGCRMTIISKTEEYNGCILADGFLIYGRKDKTTRLEYIFMVQNLSVDKIKEFEHEFKQFMGITDFPPYQLTTKKVSLSVADLQGFDSAASTFYDPKTNNHTLQISTNLILSKYLIFHEFTHILDASMYANGDSIKYAGLSGYTEYHASQIELLQLLGAKTEKDIISFKMDTIISTFSGEKSVIQYVREKQQHAIRLFSRADFPADINTLKSTLGVLYNYWGLRSICEMYASDYVEEVQNDEFLHVIPTMNFCLLNVMMHGWLDQSKIEKSIPLYINTIFPLIEKYKLI